MTNDPRVQTFHDYKFADYVQDQTEIAQLRTELDDLTGTSRKAIELMNEAVAEVVTLRAQLAEVTGERDRLRVALIECAVPLEVLNAIDCELAPTTQAGITAAVTAIRAALFSAQPEPKPEAPKLYQCPMCSAEVDYSTLGAMAAHVLMCGRQHGTAASSRLKNWSNGRFFIARNNVKSPR